MTRITDAYFGGREIMKVYRGDRLIWERKATRTERRRINRINYLSTGETQIYFDTDFRKDALEGLTHASQVVSATANNRPIAVTKVLRVGTEQHLFIDSSTRVEQYAQLEITYTVDSARGW